MTEERCHVLLVGSRDADIVTTVESAGSDYFLTGILIRFAHETDIHHMIATREDTDNKHTRVDGRLVYCVNEVVDVGINTETDTPSLGESLTLCKLRSADVVMLVYNITSQASFDSLRAWYNQFFVDKDVPRVLVATMCEQKDRRQVSETEGENLAKEWGCPFFETSAKTGKNVKEAFHQAVREHWSASNQDDNANTQKEEKNRCTTM